MGRAVLLCVFLSAILFPVSGILADTLCKNCTIDGTSQIRSGTVTLQAAATLDLSAGTVIFANGQIPWAKVAKTAPDLAFSTTAISASAIDWATSQSFSKTLGANTTFTFSNTKDGQTIVVALTNTASNYTVTWPTVIWSGGAAPTQTIGAKTDVYTFIKIGSTIFGSVVQNMY
jgi:hypothetical protein